MKITIRRRHNRTATFVQERRPRLSRCKLEMIGCSDQPSGLAPAVQQGPPSQPLPVLAGLARASAADARVFVKVAHHLLSFRLKRSSKPIMLLSHAASLASCGLVLSCEAGSLEKPTNHPHPPRA